MRPLLWIPLCAIALFVPVAVLAGGAGSGFDSVVGTLETRYHVHATRIPFLGVVSFIARRATHEGVANLHVAEFEHFDAEVDGSELDRLVEDKIGNGWSRVIRETSRKGGEQTLIFMRPEGNRMGLFVVDRDGSEMDVVQLSVDPDHLNDSLGQYQHHHNHEGQEDHEDQDQNVSD